MREIKFRAWLWNEKEMSEVLVLDNKEEKVFVVRKDGAAGWRMFAEVELVQYTGLKDKNGVEIYEGDIDQAENGDKSVIVFLLKAGTYCVMPMDIYLNNDYQNESFFPDFIYGFGYDLFFDNCTPDKYLNIIGNIYEHNHLIG